MEPGGEKVSCRGPVLIAFAKACYFPKVRRLFLLVKRLLGRTSQPERGITKDKFASIDRRKKGGRFSPSHRRADLEPVTMEEIR